MKEDNFIIYIVIIVLLLISVMLNSSLFVKTYLLNEIE